MKTIIEKEPKKSCECHCHIDGVIHSLPLYVPLFGDGKIKYCKCIKNCEHCNPEKKEEKTVQSVSDELYRKWNAESETPEWEKEFDRKFLDKFENRRGVMPLAMAPVIKAFISKLLEKQHEGELDRAMKIRDVALEEAQMRIHEAEQLGYERGEKEGYKNRRAGKKTKELEDCHKMTAGTVKNAKRKAKKLKEKQCMDKNSPLLTGKQY